MTVNNCDICKKAINDKKIGISMLGFSDEIFSLKKFDLCSKCAEPVMKFLKTKKLIKQDKK
ncbi:MAG: hypothetical protein WCS97_02475 [Candidatus Paceibacterota bacterium]|jgi:hypothetical protein